MSRRSCRNKGGAAAKPPVQRVEELLAQLMGQLEHMLSVGQLTGRNLQYVNGCLRTVGAVMRQLDQLEDDDPGLSRRVIEEMDDLASAWLLRQLSLWFGHVPMALEERIKKAVVQLCQEAVATREVKPLHQVDDDDTLPPA